VCGISGFLGKPATAEELYSSVRRMTDAIRHRGPDDDGHFVDPSAGVAIGSRRLAVIDLSPDGHQPMVSPCGRWVLAFNGEVYNYEAIRRELQASGQAPSWRGHSDTEVLLAAITAWGVRSALDHLNGMFAFAVWDRAQRTLYLARDRIGEKPLYFGWVGSTFMFGSELKAMQAHPQWHGTIDRDALALFFRYNHVPAPYSIWQGVSKLPPASLLTLPWGGGAPRRLHRVETYWSAHDTALAAFSDPLTLSDDEAASTLHDMLADAVKLRMYADVPLGAFLSGGIDSSTVAALMQAQSSRPVRTFTIGFRETGFNEAHHAKAVAAHLGTDHTELYVSPSEVMAVIPRLPALYDEPFADSSQIPTFLICELARRHVTVALSGDGGDELFGGYRRHVYGQRVWQHLSAIPLALRSLVARGLTKVAASRVCDTLLGGIAAAARVPKISDGVSTGVATIAAYLNAPDRFTLYHQFQSNLQDPATLVVGAAEPLVRVADPGLRAGFTDFRDEMMFLDLISYLPDDILVKVDRASMGVSLEARVPFLDHRVVELAWRIPLHMKVRDGVGKWLLRQVLFRYVPRQLVERPKTGFGVPRDSWLHGPLRSWAEDLLSESRLRNDGYLNVELVRSKWLDYMDGRRSAGNFGYLLWGICMFQSWLQQSAENARPSMPFAQADTKATSLEHALSGSWSRHEANV
jgi:asparagine synthase (glutamine-hydrolysing)